MDFTEKKSRRRFIKNAAVTAIAPTLLIEKKPSKVVHQVFFWLKNADSETDKKELINGIKSLKPIPQIKKLLIGTPAATEKREVVDNSYNVSELVYFDSVKDQNDYQIHPLHKSFVEKYSHLWKKVIVYDFETI